MPSSTVSRWDRYFSAYMACVISKYIGMLLHLISYTLITEFMVALIVVFFFFLNHWILKVKLFLCGHPIHFQVLLFSNSKDHHGLKEMRNQKAKDLTLGLSDALLMVHGIWSHFISPCLTSLGEVSELVATGSLVTCSKERNLKLG